MNKLAILEGLLFIVGDEGLSIKQIIDVLEVSEEEARKLLKELQKEYESEKLNELIIGIIIIKRLEIGFPLKNIKSEKEVLTYPFI